MELYIIPVFFCTVALAFAFLQRIVFRKATHKIIKTLPLSASVLAFLLCQSIGFIKIHTLESKDYYLQMAVDEVEVLVFFGSAAIGSAIIGCLLGLASVKIFRKED